MHIHDETTYANASAYFGMNNLWDDASQQMHFGNKDLDSEEGTIVFIDSSQQTVTISGMGRAIGHYARWVKRGAQRVEVTLDPPLVRLTAFWHEKQHRLVLVAINSTQKSQQLDVRLKGVTLTGAIAGEQSTQSSYWQPLSPPPAAVPNRLVVSLPPQSITTLWGGGTAG
jgi:uncharacterized protein (DUF952 family)